MTPVPLLITPDELADLTDYKRAASQVGWLLERGIPFDVGASGRPKVLRSVILTRLGVDQTQIPDPAATAPNVVSLQKAVERRRQRGKAS